MPGMYAQVNFETTRSQPPMLIPTETLVIRADGPKVARITPGQTVHFQYVQLGRDFGETVEIVSGLQPGDEVVINPGDRVQEGAKVKTIFPAEAPANPGRK